MLSKKWFATQMNYVNCAYCKAESDYPLCSNCVHKFKRPYVYDLERQLRYYNKLIKADQKYLDYHKRINNKKYNENIKKQEELSLKLHNIGIKIVLRVYNKNL